MKTMFTFSALKSCIEKIITFSISLFLLISISTARAQTGTSTSPFTSLGQAQNISAEGVYYFNLAGNNFSTYVKMGGWVQVAIDFAGSTGGAMPQLSALNLTSRGILTPSLLSLLTTANKARIYVSTGQLDVQNTNATIMSRIVSNQALHKGGNDNSFNNWTGTNTLGASFSAGGCNASSNNGLHQRVIHTACTGTGVHWIPVDNMRQIRNDLGEIPSGNYFQLLVQAPFVAVVNGPTINNQPSNAAQNVCIGSSATTLSVSATSASTISYQWYSNTSASTSGGTIIAGATSSTYTPPTNIAGVKYYYVVLTNTQGSTTSAVSGAITVSPLSVAGTASTNQTICSGVQPSNISLSGNTGTIQWQVSTDNISFANISGATSSPLTSAQMGALTSTRYYRAIVTSGACSAATSNAITVTVTPLPTINTTTPGAGCGTGTVLLGASAASGTLNWYAALTGGSSLGSGTSYTTPSISTTTTYYVDVTANGCTSSPRTAVIATINALPMAAGNAPATVEYLVVGGGGGGGFDGAGGGGGGQVKTGTVTLGSGTYPVTIGNGGANATSVGSQAGDGGTSTLSFPTAITSIGGGGGGSKQANGRPGANGGGGGHNASATQTGGASTVGGFSGGSNNAFGGGGGGGAAAAGTQGAAGNGGNGIANSITGTSVYYGGGGGGGSYNGNGTGLAGLGGAGRGGLGTVTMATAGTANTGGGGGGAGEAVSNPGKSGGSGVVIVKYAGPQNGSGGVITSVGGYTIHTFNSNGSFVYNGGSTSATVPNVTSCGASAVTFTGTVSAGLTLDWYDAATGGNLLSQGTTSYTTPVISTTTTYYVAVRNSTTGCVSATRLAVTATINSASTVTANQAICMGATPSNITVTSASGTIQWQSSTNNTTFTNISGQTSATLTGATIGALYSTMYYRAVITNGACAGNSPVHTITVSNPTISGTPVSTDLVWTGKVSTDWTNASNWLSYNGTTYGVAAGIPSNTTNVFIQGTNACVLNQPTIATAVGLTKSITIETGATLTMNTGSLTVKGNWTKNGSFLPGTGSVTFNGTVAQTIAGNGATSFTNLTINNSSSGLTLNAPADVSSSLTMTAGNIATTSTNLLTLGVGSVGTLNWASGTIVGPFKRWFAASTNTGNVSGLFPVGTATTNRWALLEYASAPTTAGYLSAEFKAVNPTTTTAGTNGMTLIDQYNWQLDNIATDGYWEIIPTTIDGGSYDLTLRPNAFSTIGSTYDVCRIIKSPNAHVSWTLDGMHGTTNGTLADFTISRTGMSGFSYFAIAYPTAAPLPVELISFQANCIENQGVKITWSTVSEHNSANFTVEKSRDGMNWVILSEIEGAGNSTTLLNYEIIDSEKTVGVAYYRLTQFDFDGASETFNIASVNCGSSELSETLKVYPNPSEGEFFLEFENTSTNNEVILSMFDLEGNVLHSETKTIEKGSNIFLLKNLNAASGIYFIEVKMGDVISIVKHSVR